MGTIRRMQNTTNANLRDFEVDEQEHNNSIINLPDSHRTSQRPIMIKRSRVTAFNQTGHPQANCDSEVIARDQVRRIDEDISEDSQIFWKRRII